MNGATEDYNNSLDISEEQNSFQQNKPNTSQKKTFISNPKSLDTIN